jgi:hypothetical protein
MRHNTFPRKRARFPLLRPQVRPLIQDPRGAVTFRIENYRNPSKKLKVPKRNLMNVRLL